MSPIRGEMKGLNSSTDSNSTTGSKRSNLEEESNSEGSEGDADEVNFADSTCGGSGTRGSGRGPATCVPNQDQKGYGGIEQPTSSTPIYGPSSDPKFLGLGTLIPNRVFVGGITCHATESELSTLFSKFGNVRESKIIMDRVGVSKGYGFVTFETEEEVKALILANINGDMPPIVLKDRRLNIAPAVRKQQPIRPWSSFGPFNTGPFYCGKSTQGDFFVPPMLQTLQPPISQNAAHGSQGYGVGLNPTFSSLPFDTYCYGQSNQAATPGLPLFDNFFQQSNGFTSTSVPSTARPFYPMQQNPMGMGVGQAPGPGPNGTFIFSNFSTLF